MKYLRFYESVDNDPDLQYIQDCISNLFDSQFVVDVEVIRCWYSSGIFKYGYGIHPSNLEKRNYPHEERLLKGGYKISKNIDKDCTGPYPGYCIDVDQKDFVRGVFCVGEKKDNNNYLLHTNVNSFQELSDKYKEKYEFSCELSQCEKRLKSNFPFVSSNLSDNLNCIRFYIVSDVEIK